MATILEERHITDAERAVWQSDGALCLRGVVATEWLETLAEGIDAAMADPSDVAKAYGEGESRFRTDHGMFLRLEQFRRFMHESPMARLAAELMGATRINLYDEHLLVKEPGTDTPTWWHHDLPYFRIKGSQICSFWVPLDPVTEATGSLRFAVGSHAWGKLFRPVKIGQGDFVAETEQFDETVPDIDGDPERYPTVCFDLEPGDVAVFHGATLHSSSGNPLANGAPRGLAALHGRRHHLVSGAPLADLLRRAAPGGRRADRRRDLSPAVDPLTRRPDRGGLTGSRTPRRSRRRRRTEARGR